MARVKRGVTTHAKHKKLLKQVKGYMMTRRRLVRKAKEAQLHAGQYAYTGRKDKKGVMRRDWILHINEAIKKEGMTYSVFIHKLKENHIDLDRKILADLSANHPLVFQEVFTKIKNK